MAMQRPIVFYENLMHTYDNQVAELMEAKTSYILFTSEQDFENQDDELVSAQPVITEVLQPQKTQASPKKKAKISAKKTVETQPKARQTKTVKTGLGLSLDDILLEEDSAAARDHNQYFNE